MRIQQNLAAPNGALVAIPATSLFDDSTPICLEMTTRKSQ
jgi:hypothetical protein